MRRTIDSFLMLLILAVIAGFTGLCIESFYVKPPLSTDAAIRGTESPFYEVEMIVTAYDAGACCCGRYADGITASGKPAVGLICAAPPEYPFGTKFVVDGVVYVCEDRGGAIKGNKLDLLMPDHNSALKFGRRKLKVKVWK